ncbi:KRAB-A domain-containing protein 2 [Araneus ventricosus]|uniref:KRAB-A domain-containing protein 2 n=1 Tax=Araneus ventricosus TaxID=182803 RepID=A0A4Y2NKB4_ARAVE|nr:KRAB-A domain-containing protein 2 [Araneus ventricosus]
MIPVEEYFDALLQYHRAIGDGGRDKMLFASKTKCYVRRAAIEIFVSLCRMHNTKKFQQHHNILIRSVTAKDFNLRSQVDLIDFQLTSFGYYKWLMNYEDHATKFCLLGRLQTKRAAEVALKLMKVFLVFGDPYILQSDNSREFTVNVINELLATWSDYKIFPGEPGVLQSGIENLFRAWMYNNGSTDEVKGSRFVQWQKN